VFLFLFLLPVAYVGVIFAVAVHELLGHGLFGLLLGGKFTGFALKLDGMGWAYSQLPEGHTCWARIVHLGSGIFVTTLMGACLLVAGWAVRRRREIQLAFFLLSVVCLMDGVPYLLWNAYHPVKPGDVGKIIILWNWAQYPGATIIREILLLLGIMLYAACTVYFCGAIFSRMEAQILEGGQFTGWKRGLALLFFLALPGGAGWFSFDWNQLAPGVGVLPCVVGAVSVAVVALALYWIRPRIGDDPPIRPVTLGHLAVAWGVCLTTLLLVLLWFRHEVVWG
jgi:hypothetical protein